MSSSLRWRIVLVVVVALFALALVWPTIRWATLSSEDKEQLNLKYFQWDFELSDDLAYTRLGAAQRKSLLAERTALRWTLDERLKAYVEGEEYRALPPIEQERQRLKLELGARTPQSASLARNVQRDIYRWWHGDEEKILRLGLDLKGGIYMVVETDPDYQLPVYEKLKNRIDQFGVAEPILQRQGKSRIVIQLPGATDLEKAKRLITEKAFMAWMLVAEDLLVLDESKTWNRDRLMQIYEETVAELPERGPDPERPEVIIPYKDASGRLVSFKLFDKRLKDESRIPVDTILRIYEDVDETGNITRTPLLLRSREDEKYVLSGDDLKGENCGVIRGAYEQPEVSFEIRGSEGKNRFTDITGRFSADSENKIPAERGYRGWRLAIVLDDKVISAPNILTRIPGGKGVITLGSAGTFDEASTLALQLRSGSLPADIRIVQNVQVGPALGADSIRMGWRASLIGFAGVVVFMIVYYRVSGLFAVVALVVNLVMLVGALAAAGATLTLPGIAGIVLTIGMAVDGNVLIFERIREELAAAKKLKAAVDAGFHKALRTILDANITTLISGVLLFFLGTGPVRGFAVTLSIGICTSVFTAVVITRVLYGLLLLNKSVEKLTMLQFFRKSSFDFIRWRGVAVIGSAVVILMGLVAFGVRFRDMWGTDFKGGTQVRLDFGERDVQVGDVRAALTTLGIPYDRVQGFDTASSRVAKVLVQVRGTPEEDERLQNLPAKVSAAMGVPLADSSVESISASVSRDLGEKSAIAFVLSLLGIFVYVAWRFEFRFALGAVIALIHDVLVPLGFFTGFLIFARRQIDTGTVAAFLTIVGYSINDTIVIFDRVREDLKIMKRLDFRTIVNAAINQTLSRTILTSLTTLLVVLSLFVLGGESINNFSFAMLVGIVSGVYSTVYIATSIAVFMYRQKAT
jgi:SecD/SecF fusion protein